MLLRIVLPELIEFRLSLTVDNIVLVEGLRGNVSRTCGIPAQSFGGIGFLLLLTKRSSKSKTLPIGYLNVSFFEWSVN